MRKNLKEYFELKGAKVNNEKAYGVINGYEVNFFNAVQYGEANEGVTLHIAFYADGENRRAIESQIKLLATKFVKCEIDRFGAKFKITDWTAGRIANKVQEIIDKVSEILNNNNALGAGYCPICGTVLTEQNSRARNVEGFSITLDDDCVNQINETIDQENKEFDSAPNNYFRGFWGAVIGGVAGGVIAIILNIIGFYAGISSFVAFFVGVLLYQKFGGKPNKMMIVIVTATTFVMMTLAVVAIYVVLAGLLATMDGMSVSAFGAFSVYMNDPDFSQAFYTDLAMTLLFTVIGCVAEIVRTVRKIQRSKNI